MAKMYWDDDANPRALEGKRIAVLGYGSQGRAHAMNLRDSKLNVVVGIRKGGPTWKKAEADGWTPVTPVRSGERRGSGDDSFARYGAAFALQK